MNFPTHPARESLVGELHARPAIPIHGPARLSRLAMLAPDRAAEDAHLASLCARHGVQLARQHAQLLQRCARRELSHIC